MLPQPVFRRNVEPCETGRSSSFTRTTRWGVSSDLGFGLELPHEPTGCEKKSGTVAARQAHEIPRPNHWSVFVYRFLWYLLIIFFVFSPQVTFESCRWVSWGTGGGSDPSIEGRAPPAEGARAAMAAMAAMARKDWLPRLLETDWNWLWTSLSKVFLLEVFAPISLFCNLNQASKGLTNTKEKQQKQPEGFELSSVWKGAEQCA